MCIRDSGNPPIPSATSNAIDPVAVSYTHLDVYKRQGYAALSAAAAAGAGADAETVAAVARSRASDATVVFYVHTLEHLRRGGRIGSASALLGSALAIKPILALTDGHIAPIERCV